MIQEEEKEESKEESKEELPVPAFIPLRDLTKPQWLKVPIFPALRVRKANSMYNHMPSYFSKAYIPRLLWLDMGWSLHQVHRHLCLQYYYLLSIEDQDASAAYQETYGEVLKIADQVSMEPFDPDATSLPFVINVVNP
mmetsp:Transcript_33863/g.24896  ORF Transcript_33863/g.24896 Transcript_33863/m.24896 type:complete len:138 (+) Transcript_33863:250-663(+)